MKIEISLRGSLLKYTDGRKELTLEVPGGCTAEAALKIIGIDWTQIRDFGFVAVNDKRVMIYEQLKDGDRLKAYPKISGG